LEQNQGDSSEVLLDVPVLAEIIEEMMLPRYHLNSDGEGWSKEALNFLSCSLSGSIQSMMNVSIRVTCFGRLGSSYNIALLSEKCCITKEVDSPDTPYVEYPLSG
jgi:hypothetical protein